MHVYVSFTCIFYCVSDKIHQDLFYSYRIRNKESWNIIIYFYLKFYPFYFTLNPLNTDYWSQMLPKVEFLVVKFELVVLDVSQIDHVQNHWMQIF
jgi:hypothetical protein